MSAFNSRQGELSRARQRTAVTQQSIEVVRGPPSSKRRSRSWLQFHLAKAEHAGEIAADLRGRLRSKESRCALRAVGGLFGVDDNVLDGL
jgi:hypothetical protein